VTRLSGGQAQRVAVARVLASRRRLLFLDEPSVGLDPHRVRQLAVLIREQARALGVAAIVVTHDVALAAGVADRLFLLSLEHRRLEPLFAGTWPGALEDPGHDDGERGRWMLRLEDALVDHLAQHGDRAAPRTTPPRRAVARLLAARSRPLWQPLAVAAQALAYAPRQLATRTGDFAVVAGRVLTQTLLRPLLFYAIVSTLVGYTVLYVVSRIGGAGVRPDALLRQLGGGHVVALAPALSAILFVAASGSATNAWLGSMGLTRQTAALEALGIDRRAYLWAPSWIAVGLAYLAVAALFAAGMIAGRPAGVSPARRDRRLGPAHRRSVRPAARARPHAGARALPGVGLRLGHRQRRHRQGRRAQARGRRGHPRHDRERGGLHAVGGGVGAGQRAGGAAVRRRRRRGRP
jgi:energy-coupling factor transporter ATP-binding protein EcfA2